ncbi:hypothetical protein ACQ4PT_017666 [Festuca glaucescens]
MGLDAFAAVCCAIPVLLSLLVVRVAYVLCRSGLPPLKPHAAGLRCLIVLGSGGHTAEMMNILTELQKDRFTPRYYVAALTDNMSLQKAQVLGLGWSSIFYIESIARVKKLSLSGLLLYKLRLADQFFVQWPQLQQKYPRAQCAGRLM